MKNVRRTAVAAVCATAISTLLAYAAGNWSTLPQVGMSSFCVSNTSGVTLPTAQGPYGVVPGSTQGTGQGVCQNTVPAGPAALTGTELIPADTQLTGSAPPQTVTIPLPILAGGANAYQPVNALVTSFVIPNNINSYVLDPTSTVTSLTLTLPSAPLNGQVLAIVSSQTITNLLVQGATGQSVSNAPTVLTKSTTAPYNYEFIYLPNAVNGPLWERVQ